MEQCGILKGPKKQKLNNRKRNPLMKWDRWNRDNAVTRFKTFIINPPNTISLSSKVGVLSLIIEFYQITFQLQHELYFAKI